MWITSLTKCQWWWLDVSHKKHLAHTEAQPSCSRARWGWAFAFLGTANTGAPPALRGLHPLFLTKKRGCCFFRNRGWTCPSWAAIIYLLFVTASDDHRGGCSYCYSLNARKHFRGALFNAPSPKPSPDAQRSSLVCRSTGWASLWQCPAEWLCTRKCPLQEQVCAFVSARLGMAVEQLFSLPIPNSGWSLLLDWNQ